jgi:hypothetical protein
MRLTPQLLVHFCAEHLASLADTQLILDAYWNDNLGEMERLLILVRKKGEEAMAMIGHPCEAVPELEAEEPPEPPMTLQDLPDIDDEGEEDYPDDPWYP